MLTKLKASEITVGMWVTVLGIVKPDEPEKENGGYRDDDPHDKANLMIQEAIGRGRANGFDALRGRPLQVVAIDEPYVVAGIDTGCDPGCICGGESRLALDLREVELAELTGEYVKAVNFNKHRQRNHERTQIEAQTFEIPKELLESMAQKYAARPWWRKLLGI